MNKKLSIVMMAIFISIDVYAQQQHPSVNATQVTQYIIARQQQKAQIRELIAEEEVALDLEKEMNNQSNSLQQSIESLAKTEDRAAYRLRAITRTIHQYQNNGVSHKKKKHIIKNLKKVQKNYTKMQQKAAQQLKKLQQQIQQQAKILVQARRKALTTLNTPMEKMA